MADIPASDEEMIHRELFGVRPPARVRFYLHGSKNEDATQSGGFPVYVDRVYIEEKIPDCHDFASRLATPLDIRQNKEAYAAFERSRDWKHHALDLLPGMTPAVLATLRDLGYFTVEQLAAHTPETAHWTKTEEGDLFPALAGELPAALHDMKASAKRLVAFAKPRLRLVDGKLEQVA